MDPDQIPALLHYASVLEARDKALRQKLAVQKVMFVRAVGAARLERLGSVFASWKQVHSSQKQMKLILDAERQAREESASLKAQLDAQTLRCKGLEEDLSKNVGITRELLNALNATQQPSLPLEPAMTAQESEESVTVATLAGLRHLVSTLSDTVSAQNAHIDSDDGTVARHVTILSHYKQELLFAQAALQHQMDLCLEVAVQLSSSHSVASKRQTAIDNCFTSLATLSGGNPITLADVQKIASALAPVVSPDVTSRVSERVVKGGNNSVEYDDVSVMADEVTDLREQVMEAEKEVGLRGEHIDLLTDRLSTLETSLEFSQAEVWRLTEEVVDKMDLLVSVKGQLRQYDLQCAHLKAQLAAYTEYLHQKGLPDLPLLTSYDSSTPFGDRGKVKDLDSIGDDDEDPSIRPTADIVSTGIHKIASFVLDGNGSSSAPLSRLAGMVDASSSLWSSRHGPVTDTILEGTNEDAEDDDE